MLKEEYVLKKLRDLEEGQERHQKELDNINPTLAELSKKIDGIKPMTPEQIIENFNDSINTMHKSLEDYFKNELIEIRRGTEKAVNFALKDRDVWFKKSLKASLTIFQEEVRKDIQSGITFANEQLLKNQIELCNSLGQAELAEKFQKMLDRIKSEGFKKMALQNAKIKGDG